MPVHVLGVGAPPGAGKSTLFRKLFAEELKRKPMKVGLPKQQFAAHLGMRQGTPLYVLGDYTHPTAGGTDKLSMGVAPRVVAFVESMSEQGGRVLIAFEGDRLFGRKTLEEIEDVADTVRYVVLQPSEAALKKRRDKRGSDQGGTWLKGRETKVAKLAEWEATECYPFTTNKQIAAVEEILEGWVDAALAD